MLTNRQLPQHTYSGFASHALTTALCRVQTVWSHVRRSFDTDAQPGKYDHLSNPVLTELVNARLAPDNEANS